MAQRAEIQGGLARASFSALFWNYFGVFAKSGLAFVIGIPLARLLGPEPFGEVALAWSVIGLGNLLADLGFSSALVQKAELDERDIRFVFTLQVGLGLLWLLAISALAPIVGRFFRDDALVPVLRWLSWMFLVQAFGQVATGLLRRELAFKRIQIAQVGSYLASYLLVGIPMAWSGRGVWAIVWAQLLQGVLYSLTVYASVRHPVLPCFRSSGGRALGAFGIKVLGTNLCNWTIGNIDNVTVGRWLGPYPLGLYSRAFTLVTAPLNSLITTLQAVLFPAYSRIQEQTDLQSRMYSAAFEGMALVTLPVFLGVAIISPTIMVGLFGARWAEASPILCALSSSMPFLALLGLAGPLLWGIGKVELELRIQFSVAILTAVALWWAAQRSILVLSWVVCGLYVFRFLLMTTQVVFLLRLPLQPLLRSFATGVGLAVIGGGGMWAADTVARAHGWPLPWVLLGDCFAFAILLAATVGALRRWLWGEALKWLLNRLGDHLGGAWRERLRWLSAEGGA